MFQDRGGVFRTDVAESPEDDGAWLVVRHIPERGERVAGRWFHEIRHAGAIHDYSWDQDQPDAVRSAEWETRGLCRVTIRSGKFVVLFPGPERGVRR
jgi:hypothetical protein